MSLFCCCTSNTVHVYDPSVVEDPIEQPANLPVNQVKTESRFSLKSFFSFRSSSSSSVAAEMTSTDNLTNQVAREVIEQKPRTLTPETIDNTSGEESPSMDDVEEEHKSDEDPVISNAIYLLHADDDVFDSSYSASQVSTLRAWNAVYAASDLNRSGGSEKDAKEILGSLLSHKSYFEHEAGERTAVELDHYYGGSPSLKEHIDESINKVMYPSYSSATRHSVLPSDD